MPLPRRSGQPRNFWWAGLKAATALWCDVTADEFMPKQTGTIDCSRQSRTSARLQSSALTTPDCCSESIGMARDRISEAIPFRTWIVTECMELLDSSRQTLWFALG